MTAWTMRDAENARRRLLDVAIRLGWHVNEQDPDEDWVKLSEVVDSIEALENENWRYRLYIRGYVRDGKAVDEAAALAAEEKPEGLGG